MSRENSERRGAERSAPRIEATQPEYSPFSSGQTYEEMNWPRLSPEFREAHNRRLQARGLSAIPPPAIDLYEPPKPQAAVPVRVPDADDKREAQAAAQSFLRPAMRLPGAEGFTVNGIKQKL